MMPMVLTSGQIFSMRSICSLTGAMSLVPVTLPPGFSFEAASFAPM